MVTLNRSDVSHGRGPGFGDGQLWGMVVASTCEYDRCGTWACRNPGFRYRKIKLLNDVIEVIKFQVQK
jgi:hypothetical protein